MLANLNIDLTRVFAGIDTIIKLTALPNPIDQKFIRDENDIIEALDITQLAVEDTARLENTPLYVGQSSFDFEEDVKRAVEESLFRSRDEQNSIGLRKRNLTLYHMCIEPLIEALNASGHKYALENIDNITQLLTAYVNNHNIDPHPDDSIVTKEIVRMCVREREEIRKTAIKKRRTRKKILDVEVPDETTDYID